MAKGSPVTKLVNGEIADADVVNQIAEDVGSQGGSVPYDPSTNEQSTDGSQSLGSTAFPWGSIFLNRLANFVEVDPSTNTAASTIAINLLRKFISMKDAPGNGAGSYVGNGGRFIQVDNAEDGLQFAIPSNVQIFLSSGTFVCPAGITTVYLTLIGGGGQGGGSNGGKGGGGSSGGWQYLVPFTVVPGTSYTVTIGAGGTTGTSSSNGQNGGNTSFDVLSVSGGNGGTNTGTGGASVASTGIGGIGGSPAGGPGGIYLSATAGGSSSTNAGAGGAGTPFGPGGAGGINANDSTAEGNPGIGYGSGGGGGGNFSASHNIGGAGANGFCMIQY